ncbi:uncharacterized protein BJ171DRAFT_490931 [Polychytrium aggregatum]|uniref:uncharacterized protein n=1 Tax=Polychytrium aggregatum TaxID=110093 RepID=UPI0022FE5F1B|nr:uncharacterized protein BJ171DRAFT_490931 [Polychytrium aggregatum]KAI9208310.1 hypothetical protein BJ171DRAFT_490931 [Polychytrium aggregatum]
MGLFSSSKPDLGDDPATDFADIAAAAQDIPLPEILPRPASLYTLPTLPPEINPTDPLAVAIYHHENNRLDIATYFFSYSASQGHPIGLFLYAMSLRHGWGIEKNEALAFKLLEKAAGSAVDNLVHGVQTTLSRRPTRSNSGSAPTAVLPASRHEPITPPPRIASAPKNTFGGTGANSSSSSNFNGSTSTAIAREELTLPIYEMAMCFKQGWGVRKSARTAAYYLTVAAQLGDVDAQMALGECYLAGDGVKQSKKMAAKWFRMAQTQGAHMVQMQWIWKDKYN